MSPRFAGLVMLALAAGTAHADGKNYYYGHGCLYYPRPAGFVSPATPYGYHLSTWRIWTPPPAPTPPPPYQPPPRPPEPPEVPVEPVPPVPPEPKKEGNEPPPPAKVGVGRKMEVPTVYHVIVGGPR